MASDTAGLRADPFGPTRLYVTPGTLAARERAASLKGVRDVGGGFVRPELVAEPIATGPSEHVRNRWEWWFRVRAGTLAGAVDGEPFRLGVGDERTEWSGTPHGRGDGGVDEGPPSASQPAAVGLEGRDDNHVTSPPLHRQRAPYGLPAPTGRLVGYRASRPEDGPRTADGTSGEV